MDDSKSLLQLYSEKNFHEIERKYDIDFNDKKLLVRAFVHPSYYRDSKIDYQRLEFLGDAILELIVSDYIYNVDIDIKEGEMSKKRSKLVNEVSLLYVMNKEELTKYIIVGNSIKTFNRENASFVGDICEALIAAIYLDQGYEKAKEFVYRVILSREEKLLNAEGNVDYKTLIQEKLQQNGSIDIKYCSYKIQMNLFGSILKVNGTEIGRGTGHNKKAAEQQAAKDALKKYV